MKSDFVCFHIATLHDRRDTRVLLKECCSLAKDGFQVFLVVGDGGGDESYNGVGIVDVGRPHGRFASRIVPMWRAARKVRELAPGVIHFHDGAFLPFAIMLAIIGHRVVYDVHEDYREDVLGLRFNALVRHTASFAYAILESLGGRLFDGIVAATPHIARRFPKRKTRIVQNFPLLNEFAELSLLPHDSRPRHFAYIGGVTAYRGALEMIVALERVECEEAFIEIAGSFDPQSLQSEIEQQPGWKRVKFRGWLTRTKVTELLERARAGLVLFHPGPNHTHAQPNKLFEYMAAGIPVIASDFPLWREIVRTANCGLLVDPTDPTAVARAMNWILQHPAEAEAMGRCGRKAIEEKYNWEHESAQLLGLYRSLV